MTKYCTDCGNMLDDNAKFCSNCGKKQDSVVAQDNMVIDYDTSIFYTIKNQSIYFGDKINIAKIGSFINRLNEEQQRIIQNSTVLCYFDETITGVGDQGVAVTAKNIFYRIGMLGQPDMININEINNVEISGLLNKTVTISGKCGKHSFALSQGNTGAKMLVDFINYLISIKK